MEAATNNTVRRIFTVTNPATGEEVGHYPVMDSEDVGRAVAKAREAFAAWSKTTHALRRKIFKKAAVILAENAAHYASVVSGETGKTRFDAMMAEVTTVCDVLHYYAKNAEKFLAPVKVARNIMLPGRKAYYIFEPKGVVGIISPWNYPFTLAAGPAITAIAAGNAVVLKPSSQTTASGLILKEILEKAGLPEGVLEVLTGSGSVTGEALLEQPGIDMYFFTGSTEIGRKVYAKAAQRLKPAIMELGGKDPAIVTKNADIDRAANAIAWGAFTNCGQTCIGMELALVERPVYEEFLKKFVELTKSLKTGQGEGELGSMTMADQLQMVMDQVDDARAKGATVLTGGQRDPDTKGLYYPPTTLTDVKVGMKLLTEETFGALLPIIPYDYIDEALRIANSTPYGLSSSVFTKDMDEARSIAARLKTGSVNINDCLVTFAMAALPFGGVKESGIGRYHSRMGIQAFADVKSISEFNWNTKKEFYYYPIRPGTEKALENIIVAVFGGGILKRIGAFIKSLPALMSMLSGK